MKGRLQDPLEESLDGSLHAAHRFWCMLWSFEINPYDFYLASMMIEGKKFTVLWHVDGRKILAHTEQNLNVSDRTHQHQFGKEALNTVECGKVYASPTL